MRVWREIPVYTKLEHITQKLKKKKKWRRHRKEAEDGRGEKGEGVLARLPKDTEKKQESQLKLNI